MIHTKTMEFDGSQQGGSLKAEGLGDGFLRGEGILPLFFCDEGVPPSNRGQDARDTQGRDALATCAIPHPSVSSGGTLPSVMGTTDHD